MGQVFVSEAAKGNCPIDEDVITPDRRDGYLIEQNFQCRLNKKKKKRKKKEKKGKKSKEKGGSGRKRKKNNRKKDISAYHLLRSLSPPRHEKPQSPNALEREKKKKKEKT
jgi:hypothetical protein